MTRTVNTKQTKVTFPNGYRIKVAPAINAGSCIGCALIRHHTCMASDALCFHRADGRDVIWVERKPKKEKHDHTDGGQS